MSLSLCFSARCSTSVASFSSSMCRSTMKAFRLLNGRHCSIKTLSPSCVAASDTTSLGYNKERHRKHANKKSLVLGFRRADGKETSSEKFQGACALLRCGQGACALLRCWRYLVFIILSVRHNLGAKLHDLVVFGMRLQTMNRDDHCKICHRIPRV